MTFPLAAIWDRVRTSLWFVPSLMVAGASALAFMAVAADRRMVDGGEFFLLYGGGPDGARAVLGTIATSMMTVAGVVFSVTIVALTLASEQFGPRVLRNFMQDTGNQLVLGTFISTFVYCLLVARTIRGGDGADFTPHASVTLAVALAIVSLAVLIYFIHHVTTSIRAETVINNVYEELISIIDKLYPEQIGEEEGMDETNIRPSDSMRIEVRSPADGYVEMVEDHVVMRQATEHNLVLRLHVEPGLFVSRDDLLAEIYSEDVPDEAVRQKITGAFILGSARTPVQDVEFPLQQLVQVAVRALSPSTNDPYTAIAAIDRIVAGLRRLGGRRFPSPLRHDEEAILRVMAPRKSYRDIAHSVLQTLRESTDRSPVVAEHLKRSLSEAADHLSGRRAADLRAEMALVDTGA